MRSESDKAFYRAMNDTAHGPKGDEELLIQVWKSPDGWKMKTPPLPQHIHQLADALFHALESWSKRS